MDFVFPAISYNLGMVIRDSAIRPYAWKTFFKPFSAETWTAMLFLGVCTAALLQGKFEDLPIPQGFQ